jgi:cellulose synthase/poly-beta-1,6-N-acetylglucosamine synthase-like glycosyltransferase
MVVLTVVFILYFLMIVLFLIGWKRATQDKKDLKPSKDPFISVIIPARNEELTIGNLLTDLSRQEYRNFEIIVVNDDSEDETLWMVSRFDMKNLQVIHSKGTGKKAAITSGIRIAKGSIVVTTDADCSVSPEWLKHIRDGFRDPREMMIFGGVRMVGDNKFFDSLQAMEFSSLIGTGAVTASLGFPTVCNAANLAFRKKVFSEVKGYDDNIAIPSGDDEFLMRKIHNRYPGSVHFMKNPETVVATRNQPSLEAFVNQRLRWASKWRYNSSLLAKGLAVVVLLFQLSFIINWFYIFTSDILQALFLIAVKMILEAAFLLQVCRFLGTKWNWLAFFSLQLVYPLYVIGIGTASFFAPFQWKNRTFRPAPLRRL